MNNFNINPSALTPSCHLSPQSNNHSSKGQSNHRKKSLGGSKPSNKMQKSVNEMIFQALLTDPSKRAQVLELLTKEGLVPVNENVLPNGSTNKTTPGKRHKKNDLLQSPLLQLLSPKVHDGKKKIRLESPSALCRRRALQRLESDSSVDEPQEKEKLPSPPPKGTPVPVETLLRGVIAYCEIRSNEGDRSAGIKAMMKTMGATVRDTFTRDVTHVVFKDGLFSTFQKAKLLKVHLVSVLWLEAIRRNKFRVPESKYPALGVEAYDANVSTICQAMQQEYNDVVKDEYRRRSECKSDARTPSQRNHFVTQRRKTSVALQNLSDFQLNSSSSSSSGFQNRTELSTPYKHRCETPAISESDTDLSSESASNHGHGVHDDIVPCSQDVPQSLSHSHRKNHQLSKINEEEINDDVTNLAKHVKDSFELKTAAKIRSPESLRKSDSFVSSREIDKTDENEESSMCLQISTTDDSNANSTRNKSGSSDVNSRKTSSGSEMPRLRISSSFSRNSLSNANLSNRSNDLSASVPGKNKTRLSTITKNSPAKLNDLNLSAKKNPRKSRMTINTSNENDSSRTVSNLEISENDKTENISNSIAKSRKSKLPTEDSSKIVSNKQITCNDNTNEVQKINSVEKSAEKHTTDEDSAGKSKPRVRKLFKGDQAFDENLFNWENAQNNLTDEPEVPAKKVKHKIKMPEQFERAKLLSSRAKAASEKKSTKSAAKSTSKQPTLAATERKVRRSMRALSFNDTSPEKPKNPTTFPSDAAVQPIKTPSTSARKSFKLIDNSTNKKLAQITENQSNEMNTDSPVKRLRKSIRTTLNFNSESSDEDESKTNDKNIKSPPPIKKNRKSNRVQEPELTEESECENKKQNKNTSPCSSVLRRSTRKSRCFNNRRLESDTEDSCRSNLKTEKTNNRKLQSDQSDSDNTTYNNQASDADQSEKSESPLRRSTRKSIYNTKRLQTPLKTPTLRKNTHKITSTQKKSDSSDDQFKLNHTDRRSTLEFVQRPSRKSMERIKLSQKPKQPIKSSIVCTRLHKADVQVFQQIVKKLGGYLVEDEVTERTTHLVAGAPSRTINMLRAMARGCWILRQEWLFKSLEAGKWLEEEEYEMTEFSPAVQKCRLEKQSFGPLYSMDLFKDSGAIYVSRASNPRCSDLEELVVLCGGALVKVPRQAQIIIGELFKYENTVYVTEKWLLDSITHNKKKSFKTYLISDRSERDSTASDEY